MGFITRLNSRAPPSVNQLCLPCLALALARHGKHKGGGIPQAIGAIRSTSPLLRSGHTLVRFRAAYWGGISVSQGRSFSSSSRQSSHSAHRPTPICCGGPTEYNWRPRQSAQNRGSPDGKTERTRGNSKVRQDGTMGYSRAPAVSKLDAARPHHPTRLTASSQQEVHCWDGLLIIMAMPGCVPKASLLLLYQAGNLAHVPLAIPV